MIFQPIWAGRLAIVAVGACMSLTGCNGTVHTIHGESDDRVMCTTSSTGGAGGTGGSGGTSSTGGGMGGTGGSGGIGGSGGAGSAGGAGGSGGAGGAPTCFDNDPGCAEYIIINPGIPWCDQVTPDPTPGTTNPSYVLYNDLVVCVCGDPNNPAVGGTCKDECMNEACGGQDVVAEGPCALCINNTMTGCGNAFNACAND